MARKKRAKKRRGPPDRRARDQFYMVEVTGFSVGGGASTWDPDKLPDIYGRDYIKTPQAPILHEDLDVHMDLRQVDPVLREVTDCTARLHGERRFPPPDYEFYGGAIYKRKERMDFWFHSSLNLTRDLASALLAGRSIFLRFQGAQLYYGSASLCGIEWWDAQHPDLLAELADSTPC